mgnify:CR=1 FL=1
MRVSLFWIAARSVTVTAGNEPPVATDVCAQLVVVANSMSAPNGNSGDAGLGAACEVAAARSVRAGVRNAHDEAKAFSSANKSQVRAT